jgi:hypothetical protein
MSLEEIVDNLRTDKNTVHSYLPLYEKLLCSKKESAKSILEVGIWKGGSLKLWSDYFQNAIVHGVDVLPLSNVWDVVKNDTKIVLHTSCDAYNTDWFVDTLYMKHLKFDLLLDDGPHTLESMKKFITLYSNVMADDGILIVEDVQSWEWIDQLKDAVPEHLKRFIKVYDLRNMKNRYDDIVFTIDKYNFT